MKNILPAKPRQEAVQAILLDSRKGNFAWENDNVRKQKCWWGNVSRCPISLLQSTLSI